MSANKTADITELSINKLLKALWDNATTDGAVTEWDEEGAMRQLLDRYWGAHYICGKRIDINFADKKKVYGGHYDRLYGRGSFIRIVNTLKCV
jgi:hypothetical protein